jgi:LytR cell envelope-related transcriptional attenuator
VDHPIRLDRVELAVRPWRTATVLIAVVAAVELVLLIVIGGALLAKPEAEARRAAPKAKAAVAAKPKPVARTAPAARTKAVPAELPRRKVRVIVLNGNGRQGAAATAASRVSGRGYRIGVVGNAPRHDYAQSIVMYRRGFEGEGRRLARDLGVRVVGPLDGMRPSQLHGAHAVFILGA